MKCHLSLFIYLLAGPLFAEVTLIQDTLTTKGFIYLNATESASQGEKYLLNQQLSSVQWGVDWTPTTTTKVHSLFVYNPWPTPIYPTFYFEELYAEFKKLPYGYIDIGRKWVPFGNYRNDLIYKPLTKALGQINEEAIQIGYANTFYGSLAFFKPHTEINTQNIPISYTLNLGMQQESYEVGVSYLSSIAETQLFRYNKGFDGFLGATIESQVPGFASYWNWKYKKINANLTYVTAVTYFEKGDLSYNQQGAQPSAVSLQSGYEFDTGFCPAKIIGFYDHSFQSLALKLPEERAGIGLNLFPVKYVDVQFQFYKEYSYPENAKSSGLNTEVNGSGDISNTAALQVVLHI